MNSQYRPGWLANSNGRAPRGVHARSGQRMALQERVVHHLRVRVCACVLVCMRGSAKSRVHARSRVYACKGARKRGGGRRCASPPTHAPTAAAQGLRHRTVACAQDLPARFPTPELFMYMPHPVRLFAFCFDLFSFGSHAAAPPSARAGDVDPSLVGARAMGWAVARCALWPAQETALPCGIQHGAQNARHVAWSSMPHATCAMAAWQNAIRNGHRRRATCRTRRVPCNVQRATYSMQHATYNIRHAACRTCRVHTTYNMQHAQRGIAA